MIIYVVSSSVPVSSSLLSSKWLFAVNFLELDSDDDDGEDKVMSSHVADPIIEAKVWDYADFFKLQGSQGA